MWQAIKIADTIWPIVHKNNVLPLCMMLTTSDAYAKDDFWIVEEEDYREENVYKIIIPMIY